MNKVISILKKYFNEDDINKILKALNQKQRVTIINDNYFAKVGNDSNKVFFNNLVNEIKLYENNQDNLVLPKIVDSYVSDKYTLIVLKKVNGKTLSDQRNNYNIHLSHSMRLKIARSVLEIKNIKIKCELDKKYNRKELLNKYLERVKNYLSKKTFLKIMSLSNYISKESKNIAISHGDLVPTNIILDKDIIKFVDWEYIAYRPEFYDITYFLMFSKKRHSLKIIDELNIDNNEVYKDAIILCLKEISNWIKLYGEIDNYVINKNIRRWKRELNYILKRIK
jgi:serine/threonine protein kinase